MFLPSGIIWTSWEPAGMVSRCQTLFLSTSGQNNSVFSDSTPTFSNMTMSRVGVDVSGVVSSHPCDLLRNAGLSLFPKTEMKRRKVELCCCHRKWLKESARALQRSRTGGMSTCHGDLLGWFPRCGLDHPPVAVCMLKRRRTQSPSNAAVKSQGYSVYMEGCQS